MAIFEKLANNEVKYTITIEAKVFDEQLVNTFRSTRKRYSVPGFRKGKAPRAMIERHYGEGVFYEETFQALYWDAYYDAVKESEFVPVDRPDITIENIGKGEDLVFLAQVPVRPDIEVESSQYKGIELETIEYTVSDADLQREIDKDREKVARFLEVDDRPIENGDQVNIDYCGSIDGVEFPGGTAEGQTLVIGSGRFIPGFEEQMIGMVSGEEKDLNVAFPEEYHAEELAGKQAVFHVKVNDIKVKELPELDDEFAKDVSDFDTFQEYEDDIRERLQNQADVRTKNTRTDRILNKLIENVQFDVPEPMIDSQIDYMLNDMRYKLAEQNIKLEEYLSYMGMDMESARQSLRADANKKVRSDLILSAIAKNENIEISDEMIDEEIETFSKSMNKTLEEAKNMFNDNDIESIKADLSDKKALELVTESVVWTEPVQQQEAQD